MKANGFNKEKPEKILARQIIDGEECYLIKWLGQPVGSATWEPFESAPSSLRKLIEKYKAKNEKPIEQDESSRSDTESDSGSTVGAIKRKHGGDSFPPPSRIVGVRKKGKEFEYAIEWKVKDRPETLKGYCKSRELADNWPHLLVSFLEEHLNIP